MIQNSFCFLKSGDIRIEKILWQEGVKNWKDFYNLNGSSELKQQEIDLLGNELKEAEEEYGSENSDYFYKLFPESENWRLFKDFEKNTMFFDIECTGLGFNDKTTMLGTLFRGKFNALIRGQNLSRENVAEELRKAKLLVSFNGSQFDIPFLEKEFRVKINIPHVDLRFTGYQIGLRGGLKSIEKELNFQRDEEIQNVDGFEATRLWRNYLKGNKKSLQTLVEYNKYDVENLEKLMNHCYNKLKKKRLNEEN